MMRFGILGAGRIAGGFASCNKEYAEARIDSIGSRDLSKAKEFAGRFELPRAYGSYRSIVNDKDLDAVYIALPNGLHKQWTIAAMLQGKHVICEKPLTCTKKEAELMFEAADKAGVKLIEGFLFRFQPQTIEVLRRIKAGDIGEVRAMTGGFGFNIENLSDIRMDVKLGGGAIWDVGAYVVNLTNAVMGGPPERVYASARRHEAGVDMTSTLLLEYASGATASIWSSFETTYTRRASIVGSIGYLDYGFPNDIWSERDAYEIRMGNWDKPVESVASALGKGFVHQVNAFTDLVAGKPGFQGTTPEESIANIGTIEALIKSFRTGRPIKIAAK
jgi:predicted dehydrogenase